MKYKKLLEKVIKYEDKLASSITFILASISRTISALKEKRNKSILQDKRTIVLSDQKVGQGGLALLSKDKIYDQFHNTPVFHAI